MSVWRRLFNVAFRFTLSASRVTPMCMQERRKRRMIAAIFTNTIDTKNGTRKFFSSIYSTDSSRATHAKELARRFTSYRTSYDNAHAIVRDKCKIISQNIIVREMYCFKKRRICRGIIPIMRIQCAFNIKNGYKRRLVFLREIRTMMYEYISPNLFS